MQGRKPMFHLRRFVTVLGLVSLVGLSACSVRQNPNTTPDSLGQGTTPADFETQLAQYVEAQEALAGDDFPEAKSALDSLLIFADATTAPLVRSASNATDLETMRARFKPLSEYLAEQDLPLGYARAYCPMYDGGSNWVQADGPVRNPYYGSFMLTCGVVDAAPGAHMDHTPRHGGTVFMAPDSFHHIEGSYPEDGIFRLYATDNYRAPVDVSAWSGRVVLEEEYDSETDEFIEVIAVELIPDPAGHFLEAVSETVSIPAEIIAKVTFGVGGEEFPEERFDFIFSEYSADADAPSMILTADAPDSSVPLATRIQPDIPELTSELVNEVVIRSQQLQELVTTGRFTELFIPALQGKELALILETRPEVETLPIRQRNSLRIAVRHLVRAAYLLDWYGDLGNKQQVSGAYDVFEEAVNQITEAFNPRP